MRKEKKPETRVSRKGRITPYQAAYDEFLGRLIAAREEVGLTQREAGKLLGRSHSFLSKCETGERSIEVFELLQIAEIYKKPAHYFLELGHGIAKRVKG